MKRRLGGVLRLTRFQEYICFVIITTLLGAAVARGSFGWRLIIVLVANWLAVGFAFMINDVEDAPDDALNPAKVERNPVSAGDLSVRSGRAASFIGAVVAAALYAWLGLWPFVIGVTCLALSYLYSWRRIRLKSIPVADLVSHALMLAGLQFFAAYFTFGHGPAWQWVFPFTFVVAISLYGQIFNELRDFEGDLRAGVTHTASVLGRRAAHLLMMALFCIGIVSATATVFVVRLIPIWVLLGMVALAAVFVLRPLLKVRRTHSAIELQQPFQKPLEMAGAVALATWFVGPWALSVLYWEIMPVAQRWMIVIAQWGPGR
jgi:4-hydroxybenzoate polyprenyltransferase